MRRVPEGAGKAESLCQQTAPVGNYDSGLVAWHHGPQGFGPVQEKEEIQTSEGVEEWWQEGQINRMGISFAFYELRMCASRRQCGFSNVLLKKSVLSANTVQYIFC